jgi:hypothetical protein
MSLYSLGVLCALAVQLHWSLHFQRIAPAFPLQGHNNCTAADIREPIAVLVSFQWQQPSQPPHKNAISAALTGPPACHFGGI